MRNALAMVVLGTCILMAGCSGVGDNGQGDPPSGGGARAAALTQKKQKQKKAKKKKQKAKPASQSGQVHPKVGKPVAGSGHDRDCPSFQNQRQAQKYLLPGDPDGLDADGDGRACASLPCPCAEVRVKRPPDSNALRINGYSFTAPVLWVSDGDTINVARPGGGEEAIRLIGIDTPEVYGGVECGGPRASAAMKAMAVGRVRVTTDPSQDRRDRYGRLLAYVNKGARDLGRLMVARGLASVYVYDGYFRRFNSYNRAQNRAIAADRGSLENCDLSPG